MIFIYYIKYKLINLSQTKGVVKKYSLASREKYDILKIQKRF